MGWSRCSLCVNVAVIEFFSDNVKLEEFVDKSILEVGSKYVNGGIRPLVERFIPNRACRCGHRNLGKLLM